MKGLCRKNEKYFIDRLPKEKLNIVWVLMVLTGTPDLLKISKYNSTSFSRRNGKIGAMNRGIICKTPIVIFSDANTNLGKESIRRIVNLFNDSSVGCVSGEKRIVDKESDVASGAGEVYWKYESALKKWDAELYSVLEQQENYSIQDSFKARRERHYPR
jgi:cellulose synthase/poly-beta-1,6-N-acetylglucosamine synthase-like glycosyltransferase